MHLHVHIACHERHCWTQGCSRQVPLPAYLQSLSKVEAYGYAGLSRDARRIDPMRARQYPRFEIRKWALDARCWKGKHCTYAHTFLELRRGETLCDQWEPGEPIPSLEEAMRILRLCQLQGAAHSPRWVLELAHTIVGLPLVDRELHKMAQVVLSLMPMQEVEGPMTGSKGKGKAKDEGKEKGEGKGEATDSMTIPPWRQQRAVAKDPGPRSPVVPSKPMPARKRCLNPPDEGAGLGFFMDPPGPMAPTTVADHDPYEVVEEESCEEGDLGVLAVDHDPYMLPSEEDAYASLARAE